MLARSPMSPVRALDQLWRRASVDRAMRQVIEGLPENRSVVRAMAKASGSLSEAEVQEALRRLRRRADWRDEEDLFPESATREEEPHGGRGQPLTVDVVAGLRIICICYLHPLRTQADAWTAQFS